MTQKKQFYKNPEKIEWMFTFLAGDGGIGKSSKLSDITE